MPGSNGRDGRALNVREKAYAEVIAVREEMKTQSNCDDVVLNHLRPFVSKPGHYRMRGTTPDNDVELEIDDFCAWPSVAASNFGEGPLPMLLRRRRLRRRRRPIDWGERESQQDCICITNKSIDERI